ncbi:MAG: UDP-N-acetylmuramoyl-L-alanyl-D-glutamate--2,6-diaminopimelate ligase [Arthrobacter sp.]|uniref:UDP-N-acetylmuramoyl-L-alanyl-D-glutamate--2, 6-diaminopimelate ligase n=1 Tax=Arthrobacter sp. 179 TaxID=3457734 RepID=UPI00264E97DC|nr:UDP-N-acetylmuramoyl-L-alanyl-D-glutamate--2,6-diaminopimelate ligase [Micrococcaceae bacterium]MDN5885550.1 UDP-N-acetylmuramoyl-L-alanyl-D-glutamate--2,6-diaminopimelate ligase [Micrococcaceae bacterium]MDN6299345.1 UDP-N-acetylmuramoyl-L-alanyl-D-glutamate--2,6-diaminopimelate ligase [Micrococcaceae bacterium]
MVNTVPPTPQDAERAFRPDQAPRLTLNELAGRLAEHGITPRLRGDGGTVVQGVCLDSRAVLAGDLYAAVPGARSHGADYCTAAANSGAGAILADESGEERAAATGLPVLVVDSVRASVGPVAAILYGSEEPGLGLIGVTGTNGKTTTTYFITSLLRALGQRTGLIGTIEILADGTRIPSVLTTPEAPQLHALLARMRAAGVDTVAMEVSSHSIDYERVGGMAFGVAGFTNLTQDHLDLHGSMEAYFEAKSRLFAAERSARAVITVDDAWGRRMARSSTAEVSTLRTVPRDGAGADEQLPGRAWSVQGIAQHGLGHEFEIHGPDGERLRAHTGLPGLFNVSNAALALLMVHVAGIALEDLQRVLDASDPLTVAVPGRMQVICDSPAAVVDFAHNSDALERAIEGVRGQHPDSRVIVVFGATGDRDATKRPTMGAVAARHADVVIITDDDPHNEEAGGIRRDVLTGALEAIEAEGLGSQAAEIFPRADAIVAAVAMARAGDTILVAGRGHEVWQEVNGVNVALDDRVELRQALLAAGHSPRPAEDGSTDSAANG